MQEIAKKLESLNVTRAPATEQRDDLPEIDAAMRIQARYRGTAVRRAMSMDKHVASAAEHKPVHSSRLNAKLRKLKETIAADTTREAAQQWLDELFAVAATQEASARVSGAARGEAMIGRAEFIEQLHHNPNWRALMRLPPPPKIAVAPDRRAFT
eukprot:SAG11_NODE_3731_length_2258_cov_1.651691_1_plen_154_part_10